MPYARDDQLADTVAVRRKRPLAGFLFRVKRTRTIWQDRVSTFMRSLTLAVAIYTVYVAIAFVMTIFRTEVLKQQRQQ